MTDMPRLFEEECRQQRQPLVPLWGLCRDTPPIVSTLGVSETRRVTRRIAKTWMLQQTSDECAASPPNTEKRGDWGRLPQEDRPTSAGNTCLVLDLFHLVYVSSVIVLCESAKGVYKSSLYTEASLHRWGSIILPLPRFLGVFDWFDMK